MRGHIRRRGKRSWAVVVELPPDPGTGKRRQQWHSVKGTKADAERKLREILTAIDQGSYIKPARLTVSEFLQQWLRDYAAVNVRPKTYERYESIIRMHLSPVLGAIHLAELQPSHIQACHTKALNQRSPRSVAQHHRVLSEALSHAVKWGLVARNVAQAVDAPRYRGRQMRVLNAEEIQKLLEVAQGIYHRLIHLALHTGMRRSELLALRWRNVDLDMAMLHVVQVLHRLRDGSIIFDEPKSKNGRRQVALTPESVMSLRQHQGQQRGITRHSLVFAHDDGSPILPDSLSHAFTRIAYRAGLQGVRFHDLRHTHATLMLQQGIHPKIVSERLGHGSVSITLDTYSHVTPGLQEAAAKRFGEGLRLQNVSNFPREDSL